MTCFPRFYFKGTVLWVKHTMDIDFFFFKADKVTVQFAGSQRSFVRRKGEKGSLKGRNFGSI